MLLAMMVDAGVVDAEPMAKRRERWLKGDWGGYRTDLFNKGVDLQVVYVGEVAYNLGGGVEKQLVDYTGEVAFGTTLDLERIFGLHDALIQITYNSRFGRNLVDDTSSARSSSSRKCGAAARK